MRIRSPWLTRLTATMFTGGVWLLFRTLRLSLNVKMQGTNPYDASVKRRFFYCVWHDSMVIPAFGGRHQFSAALTSQHADGSFVANVLHLVGMSTIRGSTNHIRSGSIRKLFREIEDKHIVVTPDGPRGPRREISIGIVFLASRTGRAIVPTAYSCSRCWRIKGSWTDLVIPKPFAQVYLLADHPIEIPAAISRKELQQYAMSLQSAMDRLNEEAEELCDRSSHP